jgi:membrane associated rhomboid family serine protease
MCSKGFTQSVSRNFYHVNNTHIIFNLVAFNMLSHVEDYIGTIAYIVLLFLILFISSVLDFII